jgi:hypothetical protein
VTEEESADQWLAAMELGDSIERASRHMKVEWPGLVDDWQDIASEIVLNLVSDKYATRVLEMEPKARRVVLVKIGNHVASRMRDEFDYFNGNFKYSTKEVRKFLEAGAIEHALDESGVGIAGDWAAVDAGDGRKVFGERVAVEPFDIRVTFPQLEKHHREILVRRFVYAESLSEAVDRVLLQRAIESLTHLMNRAWRKSSASHEGPGSKPNLTNQEALNKSRSEE